jgi:hypothetical protein
MCLRRGSIICASANLIHCSTEPLRAQTKPLDHRGAVRMLEPQKKRETRCVVLRVLFSPRACSSMTSRCSTQAYLWWGIYDSQHKKNVQLEKELVRTQERLRLKEQECSDANWTLQELTNGAGRAAINLFRAGQLQDRISCDARDRIQHRVWSAEAAMNRACAREINSRQ